MDIQKIAAIVAVLGGIFGVTFFVHDYFAKTAELADTKAELDRARCQVEENLDIVNDKADLALATLEQRQAFRDLRILKRSADPEVEEVGRLQQLIKSRGDAMIRIQEEIMRKAKTYGCA